MTTRQKNILYNCLFFIACGAIWLFLYLAPPETTARLPHDRDHERFLTMDKKEAESQCENCHGEGKESPLPATHPPKYRCLFCHKRT